MSSEDKEFAGVVTPPGLDNERTRNWLEEVAHGQGWQDLEWRDEIDQHGNPMGRLFGRRVVVG